MISSHLEDSNKTNDCKTIHNHNGKLVVANDTNAGNNTLRPRTFYALYILAKMITVMVTLEFSILRLP